MNPTVLILCPGNSCRSHLAEGILRAAVNDLVDVQSAGSKPAGYVHPLAIQVMKEIGIDISGHRSKHLNEFLQRPVETVITLCGNADQACHSFPGQVNRYHWGFDDPARQPARCSNRPAPYTASKSNDDKLDQLAELLDIMASQKNAALERIEWKYPEEAARERGWDAVLEKAKCKAGRIAGALGVKLLGVYDFIENVYDEEMPYPAFAAQAMPMRSAGKAAPEPSLGMEIQHSKTIRVGVEIWYRVSAF